MSRQGSTTTLIGRGDGGVRMSRSAELAWQAARRGRSVFREAVDVPLVARRKLHCWHCDHGGDEFGAVAGISAATGKQPVCDRFAERAAIHARRPPRGGAVA